MKSKCEARITDLFHLKLLVENSQKIIDERLTSKPTISEDYKNMVGINSKQFSLSSGSQIKKTINRSLVQTRTPSVTESGVFSRTVPKKRLSGFLELDDFIRMERIEQKFFPENLR
jgi:hypothetical protein